MLRCTISAFKEKVQTKPVGYLRSFYGRCGCSTLLACSTGEKSIAVMEYWRWWWFTWVEGFLKCSLLPLAFIFYNMGFVRRSTATASTLAAAAIFMLGGIPGTLHHLYFSGSTSASMAIGACFSALKLCLWFCSVVKLTNTGLTNTCLTGRNVCVGL